jgi:cyclophilin family peptidyl-prolyl cis-trans isomerase/HEAT repeat protein
VSPVSRIAVVDAEQARAATAEQLQVLMRAASEGPIDVQVLAVRALGRLERPSVIPTLLPLLKTLAPPVRAEAADALAQAVGKDAGAARDVRAAVMERLVGETQPEVRAALCETLGRLPGSPDDALTAERALVDAASRTEVVKKMGTQAAGGRLVGLTIAPTTEVGVPPAALVGALRGLESLARQRPKGQPFSAATVDRLRAIVLDRPPPSRDAKGRAAAALAEAARARGLALMCLLPGNSVDADLARHALQDPDQQVRRLAASAPAADRPALEQALSDPSVLVRYEALRAWGQRFQATAGGCRPVVSAVGAAVDHASLLAVDLLGNPCRPEDHAVELLIDLSAGVDAASDAAPARGPAGQRLRSWHRPAHALVALAKASPELAKPFLPRFRTAGPWQVRMYTARAASILGDVPTLRTLANDGTANVRDAAVAGLAHAVGHAADADYVRALEESDSQLIITAASALSGTPDPAAAVPSLVRALARLTAADNDSLRDGRVAVLERLRELGGPGQADALRPYLRDTDPLVAERVAQLLSAWTGTAVTATPTPRREVEAAITASELDRLAKAVIRVKMRALGAFDLRLLTDLAPASCARFARLAAAGYYTGLTFHRVVPNFVIQGGSPGANEFAGAARYMRDEVGRVSQTRGTMGTSTRGRDTGDAQIYINLVDNPRLDHDFTIFGEVVRGMDVVDGILEGDTIESVELLR